MGGGYMGLAITFTEDFAEIPPYREQALWIRRKSIHVFLTGVVALKDIYKAGSPRQHSF